MKRGICTYKGDNSKFISLQELCLFLDLDFFGEKAATAESWHSHAVLLFYQRATTHGCKKQNSYLHFLIFSQCLRMMSNCRSF